MNQKANSEHDSAADASWLERNVNTVIVVLIVACIASVLTQIWPGLGYDDHHPAHFDAEEWFGFQAAFGFIVFVVIVFLGRGLRLIVERKEDYYDRD